jgi:hypothetical protein
MVLVDSTQWAFCVEYEIQKKIKIKIRWDLKFIVIEDIIVLANERWGGWSEVDWLKETKLKETEKTEKFQSIPTPPRQPIPYQSKLKNANN